MDRAKMRRVVFLDGSRVTTATFYADGKRWRVTMHGHFETVDDMTSAVKSGQPFRAYQEKRVGVRVRMKA